MNSACHKRTARHAKKFLQHFSIHSLQLVLQDEKDFSLQVPTNRQNKKSMVPRKMCNRNACIAKETNLRKRLWYPL